MEITIIIFKSIQIEIMINVRKQIDYWTNSAESDIETAEILIRSGKLIEGMFFVIFVLKK